MGRRLAAAVLLGLALPASAHAAADDIVVSDPGGGKVVVQRDPVQVSFVDGLGRTVLRQVAAPSPALAVIAPTPEHQFGTTTPPPSGLYAPFTFLVGTYNVQQVPSLQWQGNLQDVTQGGVAYAATKVLGATQQGDAVRLTLATSDPTGRTLDVTIRPRSHDALQVSARPVPADGVAAMGDAFASPADEAFHGFGGRHDNVDLRGTEFFTYLQQENLSSGAADTLTKSTSPGQDRFMFPNGPYATYYAQSQFDSSAGYGFWLDRDEIARWRLATGRPDAWQVEAGGPGLDEVVAPGNGTAAISALTALTGRQPVPPSWALGTILDREVKYPSDDATQHQGEIEGDLRDLDKYDVHLDAYRIEGWAQLPRDVLAKDIAALKARGIHPMLYFRAFVGKDKTGTDSPAAYDEALAKGYVATHADGSPYTFVSNFNDQAAIIDFTKPAAVAWWKGRITDALELGADGFMQDFGEQVVDDMHFADGSTGRTMHNRFPVLYHRATAEAVAAFEKSHPGRQIWWFNRAGYSGSAGYERANFPGDETTDWTRSAGLASQTTDMLNRAIGGAFGFTTDIGGYYDVGPYVATTKELFTRWAEWAALSPFFRTHGSLLAGTHTPWSYGAPTLATWKAMAALHARAAPLIAKLWAQGDETGVPPTRPLWLQFPGDATAAKQDQEWMLGPDVLVAPVVTEGATSRSVYFPAGCWQDPAGARTTGPATKDVAAPLDALPYFVHCGIDPFAAASSAAKVCASRRVVHITLPRGTTSVRVVVTGRAAKTVRVRSRRLAVSLTGLRRGAVTVRLTARRPGRRAAHLTRHYRTCTKRGAA